MERRVTFKGWLLPLCLIAPQVFISAVFFFYPAGQAVWQSLFIPDPFGLSSRFVGLGNFEYLLGDPYYRSAFVTTAIFSTLVTLTAMVPALFLAVLVGALTTLLGLVFALAMTRTGLRATRLLKALTVLPMLTVSMNKGTGVVRLLDRLGVKPEAVLACGDAENDVEMLALAGVGAAVANAQPAAMAAAAVLAPSRLHASGKAPNAAALRKPLGSVGEQVV